MVSFGGANTSTELLNLPGAFTRGLDGFRVKCSLLGTLFSLNIGIHPPAGDDTAMQSVAISMSLEPWLGGDVRGLPYFREVRTVSELLTGLSMVQVTMHLPGRNVVLPPFRFEPQRGATPFHTAVETLNKARAIAEHVAKALTFARMLEDEDVEEIEKVHAVVTLGEYRATGSRSVFTMNTGPQFSPKTLPKEPADFQILIKSGLQIFDLLGSKIECPLREIALTHAIAERSGTGKVVFRGGSDSEYILRRDSPLKW